MRQEDVAEATGISYATVGNLETARNGKGFSRMPPSASVLANFYGWAPGSIDVVLAGGEPTTEQAEATVTRLDPPEKSGRAALPLVVAKALEDAGELIDATVINLRRPGGGRAIIVVKGQPDAPPEEIAKDLEAWAMNELKRRRIEIPDDPGATGAAEA